MEINDFQFRNGENEILSCPEVSQAGFSSFGKYYDTM